MVDPCSLCHVDCCRTYTVTVTPFDILRISERSGMAPKDFSAIHRLRLLSYDPQTVLEFDDGSSGILGLKSHPCIFLGNDDRCMVHGYAPLSCRRYPFTLSGKMNARFCPLLSRMMFRIKGPDIGDSGIRSELLAYKDIVEEWNRKPGSKGGCLGFLLMRAKGNAQAQSDEAKMGTIR